MVKFNNCLKLIYRTILTSLLVSLLWLPVLNNAAQASPNMNGQVYYAQVAKDQDTIKPPSFDEKRSEAIKECLPPELASADIGERVESTLKEMGESQIERAFNVTDDPELSEVEKQFEACLKTKGVISSSPNV